MQRMAILLFILGFGILSSYGQTDYKEIYRTAFDEQHQMLKGEIPIDFKRAVFITENSYHKGTLDYGAFRDEIAQTGNKLKNLIRQKDLTGYKTAGNWAVFTFMTDSLPINNYKPCTYDFDDFMGDKDWTKMFVTKLMRDHSGNCHSLPYYYKILCEEIGAEARLALAPNHIYIKHINEKGQWINIELTNGGFPRDQWIIKQMAISVEAIKNEIYMDPLTDKESIAMTMFDLVSAYVFQYGYDSFVLKVTNTALMYFPQCIPLLMTKGNYYRSVSLAEMEKSNPDKEFLKNNYAVYRQTVSKIDSLGYKDMPIELYQRWVQSVEVEKQKRGITN